MITSILPTPATLASPPDLDEHRPVCPTRGPPQRDRVGMHGDGLTFRSVAWPDLTNGTFSLVRLIVVGRRYRCPSCRATRRAAHLALRTRCLYAVPAEAPQSPIRFRSRDDGGPPPTPLRSEWKANEFRFNNDARYYDYFLVRGERGNFARRVGFGTEVKRVAKNGKWSLYHYDRR
ncbi:MAG: hypothetical protein ACI9OJ_001115 [Myxococcota bacterium]|jgi:hypothetical protein